MSSTIGELAVFADRRVPALDDCIGLVHELGAGLAAFVAVPVATDIVVHWSTLHEPAKIPSILRSFTNVQS